MSTRPYEKLIAWQEGFDLCIWIYTLTKKLPPDERFGLVTQMRRSAESVPSNIAEGNSRRTGKDKAHFFDIALASLEELHSHCRICKALMYITEAEYKDIDGRAHRISFLINKLRTFVVKSL